jgi:hypothetical protein
MRVLPPTPEDLKQGEKMTEHPILFSGQMVRAILEGRKTMTRRVIKPWPADPCGGFRLMDDGKTFMDFSMMVMGEPDNFDFNSEYTCPYGVPGDRLWVREAHIFDWDEELQDLILTFKADGEQHFIQDNAGRISLEQCNKWRPSIHMPRWASRILLEVVSVRVERLQEISQEDAIAEGIERVGGAASCSPWRNYLIGKPGEMSLHCSAPSRSFQTLWDSINASRGFGWDVNPWVWVIEFRKV